MKRLRVGKTINNQKKDYVVLIFTEQEIEKGELDLFKSLLKQDKNNYDYFIEEDVKEISNRELIDDLNLFE